MESKDNRKNVKPDMSREMPKMITWESAMAKKPHKEAVTVEYLNEGMRLFKAGELLKAQNYFLSALQSTRINTHIHKASMYIGYINDKMGKHNLTVVWYEKARMFASDIEKVTIDLEIATSLSKSGDFAQSLSRFRHVDSALAAYLNSKNDTLRERARKLKVEYHSRNAATLEAIGDYPESMKSFSRAIALAEKWKLTDGAFKAYTRALRLLIILNEHEKALEFLQNAEELLSKDLPAEYKLYFLHDRAKYYLKTHDINKARGYYQDLIKKYRLRKPALLIEFMNLHYDLLEEILLELAEYYTIYGKRQYIRRITAVHSEMYYKSLKRGIYQNMDSATHRAHLAGRTARIFTEFCDFETTKIMFGEFTIILERSETTSKVQTKVFRNDVEEEHWLTDIHFYTLKYFIDNQGTLVHGKEIVEYLLKKGIHTQNIRMYVKDIKAVFGEQLSKSQKGWIMNLW